MLTILKAFFLDHIKPILIGAAVVLALFFVRKGGRDAEKVDQLKSALEGVEVRRKSDIEVQGKDDEDLDSMLRPPARRV